MEKKFAIECITPGYPPFRSKPYTEEEAEARLAYFRDPNRQGALIDKYDLTKFGKCTGVHELVDISAEIE